MQQSNIAVFGMRNWYLIIKFLGLLQVLPVWNLSSLDVAVSECCFFVYPKYPVKWEMHFREETDTEKALEINVNLT